MEYPLEPTPGSVEYLRQVWVDEGVQPWYHRQVKRWLKSRWPLLYRAVESLVTGGNNYVAVQEAEE